VFGGWLISGLPRKPKEDEEPDGDDHQTDDYRKRKEDSREPRRKDQAEDHDK
jgi:hypothetical protein